jgi:hypothetical protein
MALGRKGRVLLQFKNTKKEKGQAVENRTNDERLVINDRDVT